MHDLLRAAFMIGRKLAFQRPMRLIPVRISLGYCLKGSEESAAGAEVIQGHCLLRLQPLQPINLEIAGIRIKATTTNAAKIARSFTEY